MPKKAGIAIIAAGAVLILSALLLFAHNRREDALAGQEAETLLESVEAAIEARTAAEAAPAAVTAGERPDASPDGAEASPEPDASPSPTPLAPEMPEVMLDGYDYVGFLEIPALELKLPVMAEWDYERLRIAPCRQFGSSRTDDLVIAAHNFLNHFGRLKELTAGAPVLFTDMDGVVTAYTVERIETLKPGEVEAVQNSGCDLVLYTCTPGGRARVTVFCDRVPDPVPEQ